MTLFRKENMFYSNFSTSKNNFSKHVWIRKSTRRECFSLYKLKLLDLDSSLSVHQIRIRRKYRIPPDPDSQLWLSQNDVERWFKSCLKLKGRKKWAMRRTSTYKPCAYNNFSRFSYLPKLQLRLLNLLADYWCEFTSGNKVIYRGVIRFSLREKKPGYLELYTNSVCIYGCFLKKNTILYFFSIYILRS